MKLLKAIDEALNKTALASTTFSAKTKPDPLITDKERGLYSQMNILIAEGEN
jgi:hypothetical protein